MMAQPPTVLPAGYPIQPAALVTKKRKSSSSRHRHHRTPSSRLIASISVIPLSTFNHSPTWSSQEAVLNGQNLVTNLHALPSSYTAQLPRDLASDSLGYASFPDLRVCVPGRYKLVVSLLKMPSHSHHWYDGRRTGGGAGEVETLSVVESAGFEVY